MAIGAQDRWTRGRPGPRHQSISAERLSIVTSANSALERIALTERVSARLKASARSRVDCRLNSAPTSKHARARALAGSTQLAAAPL